MTVKFIKGYGVPQIFALGPKVHQTDTANNEYY